MAKQPAKKPKRRFLRRILQGLGLLVLAFTVYIVGGLLFVKIFDPIITGVQLQRQIESWGEETEYERRYEFRDLDEISDHLEHAVIAAEDGRFYEHAGIDQEAMREAYEEYQERGRVRGASTITQQVVKNLFFTTRPNPIRKVLEIPIALLADAILSKERILELYLNIAEWGPGGVFGAEAAAQHHYGIRADQLGRDASSRLAAILPSPRKRSPQRMSRYSATIRTRMQQMGW
ncbi:MAG: monofunctional biosynthetic peptidoglycan transglycosylase [Bacteroidota bacterium]